MKKSDYGTKEWFEQMFSDALEGVDGWGHQWRASQQYRYVLSLSAIESVISGNNAHSILDIGCGLGDFSNLVYAVNSTNTIYGMDISENAIKGARKKYSHIEFRTAALPDIAYMRRFDGIIALDCLCYLDQKDRIHAARSIFDYLNPAGWFLFSSPLDNGHQYFSERGAIYLLESAGFRCQSIFYNHAKIFSKFERPLLKILNLNRIIAQIESDPIDSLTLKKKILLSVIKAPVIGYLLKKIVSSSKNLSDRILKSGTIVRFFQTCSRRFLKDYSKSHIIILAKKDA